MPYLVSLYSCRPFQSFDCCVKGPFWDFLSPIDLALLPHCIFYPVYPEKERSQDSLDTFTLSAPHPHPSQLKRNGFAILYYFGNVGYLMKKSHNLNLQWWKGLDIDSQLRTT